MSIDRRTVLSSAAVAAAVPLLAGCGDDVPPAPEGPVGAPAESSGADPRTTPLAAVADVVVGGALFIDAKDVPGAAVAGGIVVTQPKKGEFQAFSRECTHMQCAVSDVRDGRIHCFCHNSLYRLSDGKNVDGPAPRPLTPIAIRVRKDKIFRA